MRTGAGNVSKSEFGVSKAELFLDCCSMEQQRVNGVLVQYGEERRRFQQPNLKTAGPLEMGFGCCIVYGS